MAGTSAPCLQILQYKYVEDILERRGPHREAHLKAAADQVKAGSCLIAGASGNPPSGALFVFKGKSSKEIEEFVKADPYIKAGLVSDWEILPFAVPPGLNALEAS
ncbi:hypothetical protein WJX84_003661 [Apatococcus fuscideae]|uniref:YCII-related domain-containing protein n=1 Tax=Apatococcus fuscideae TaxID=2026836 RepID=A0AAW1T609_9CHLO